MKDPVENLEDKAHPSESGFEPDQADATVHGAMGSAPILGERYKVIEELGHGGMGTVYKAEDTQDRAPRYKAKQRARFLFRRREESCLHR